MSNEVLATRIRGKICFIKTSHVSRIKYTTPTFTVGMFFKVKRSLISKT